MTRTDFSWKNQLVFPIIILASFVTSYWLKNVFLCLLGLYFVSVLCLKKQFVLLLLTLLAGLPLFFRSYFYTLASVPYDQELTSTMSVFCDTIKVNGNFVSFEGKIKDYKADFYYQLESQAEQKSWQNSSHWHKELVVEGQFLEEESRRNLHGFDAQWFAFTTHKIGTFEIEKIRQSRPLSGKFMLHKIRAEGIDQIKKKFLPKTAVYMAALLFGYRDPNFQEIRDIYSGAGLLHLFTLSGLHVYLFYGALFYLLRRFRLTGVEASLILLPAVAASILLFGGSVSVWRAAFTYILRFLLKECHLHLSAMDILSLVIYGLLLHDPKILLQFSGILSLWMSQMVVFKKKRTITFRQKIIEAQEFTLLAAPILMYSFFEFPLLGGVLTFLCYPVFKKFLLPLIFAAFALSFCPFSVSLVSELLNRTLFIFEKGISTMSQWKLVTGQPPLWATVVVLILNVFLYQSGKKGHLLLSLILLIGLQKFPLETSFAFVDVGQGDSMVFQSPLHQEVYVIDTGGKMTFQQELWQQRTSRSNAAYTLIPYLKGEGIHEIDGLFLTHGDTDHMGDTKELLKNFQIKAIYVGKGSLDNPNMKRLLKDIPLETKVVEVLKGDRVGAKREFHVLSPRQKGKGENEDSIVLATVIHGVKFLATGDLDQAGEQKLLKDDPNLQCDVLKLGHHGSRTSSAADFIHQLKPEYGIVSCGKNNRFNHPHKEVVQLLAREKVQMLRTDETGMVRFSWSVFSSKARLSRQKMD